MANNLLQQVQQLKIMIEQVKQQTLISKESVIQQTRQICEKEKNEVSGCACEVMIKSETWVNDIWCGLSTVFTFTICKCKEHHVIAALEVEKGVDKFWYMCACLCMHITTNQQ